MKLLLTSNGLTNPTLIEAFESLVAKDPADITIDFIPTAANPRPDEKDWLVDTPMRQLTSRGYRVNKLELQNTLTSHFKALLKSADVIFIGGGDSFYLSYWLHKSGLVELLPELLKTKVYAGISAGSVIAGRTLALTSQALDNPKAYASGDYASIGPSGQSTGKTLGLANVAIRPHLNSRYFYSSDSDALRSQAERLPYPVYALDDNSALVIDNGSVSVATEGEYLSFNL